MPAKSYKLQKTQRCVFFLLHFIIKQRKGVYNYGTVVNDVQLAEMDAIAEAFADVFCNGNKATSESKAIVDVLNNYLK